MTHPQRNSIDPLPKASRPSDASYCLEKLAEISGFPSFFEEPARALITAVAGNSPYLARLIVKYPRVLLAYLELGPDAAWHAMMERIDAISLSEMSQSELARHLRLLKAESALTIALADISGQWKLMQVTAALSQFGETAVRMALRFLLLQATRRGEINPHNPPHPEEESGIIILGMGKLGSHELNYSSDIDLILLFERERLPYTGARNAQHFMNRIGSDLVAILEERTPDGYVFRTDLRLRPDPMSTPLAVATTAALSYYETVGQNWERAAMIKARPIAGDIEAGMSYMRELVPFVWRKTLDFAAIADIHSIKRQMNVAAGREIDLPGHNIKTGIGGIREIEFFVQTQQLVWGGRIPELRISGTLRTLDLLVEYELATPQARDTLAAAYTQLRNIEHRLQMRNDEQTHSLPKDSESLHEVALFCGYNSAADFAASCRMTLRDVHRIYTESMTDSAPLAVDGNLVFTGVEADVDTLGTLARMGYQEGKRVSDIIQGWHRGNRRSTRSRRSRQLLTELIPSLLVALSKTANPDTAFFYFDDFISRLPSGAQIFSLFISRPEMLSLLADILGSAPALGDTLSNAPALLDSVLEADFFTGLPTKEALEELVTERLRFAHGFEQKMIYLRTFNNEKRFQAGVHLLKQLTTPQHVGAFLSDVAEVVLQSTMQEVWVEYHASMPVLEDTPFAVVALGKLGGQEMTFGSDLDIVFLYDDLGDSASEVRTHLIRISQRLISALTLLTREGRLYEVDTRLRPGGSDGPLAVSLSGFDAYFANSAWTYEHMALTRARVVATNSLDFATRVEETIRHHVTKPRDPLLLLTDVIQMRTRIAKEFPTRNPWAIKHIRGGMVDLDFMAQYLVLREAATHPSIWQRDAFDVFSAAEQCGALDGKTAKQLLAAKQFLSGLMSLQRLSAPGGAITDDAPTGLKALLVNGMGCSSFDQLKTELIAQETNVLTAFEALVVAG